MTGRSLFCVISASNSVILIKIQVHESVCSEGVQISGRGFVRLFCEDGKMPPRCRKKGDKNGYQGNIRTGKIGADVRE